MSHRRVVSSVADGVVTFSKVAYVRGEIFATAGGSARHSFLGAEVIGLLRQGLLGGKCNTHTADLRLGVANDHFVYADAVVVCHPMIFHAGTTDVVTNPSVAVEVLSKGTEAYDRGEKLAGYLALASVQPIVLARAALRLRGRRSEPCTSRSPRCIAARTSFRRDTDRTSSTASLPRSRRD